MGQKANEDNELGQKPEVHEWPLYLEKVLLIAWLPWALPSPFHVIFQYPGKCKIPFQNFK